MSRKLNGTAVADLVDAIDAIEADLREWKPDEAMVKMYAVLGPRLFAVQTREIAKRLREAVTRFEVAVGYRKLEGT